MRKHDLDQPLCLSDQTIDRVDPRLGEAQMDELLRDREEHPDGELRVRVRKVR